MLYISQASFHQTNFLSLYSIESDLCELTKRALTSRELFFFFFFYSASLLVFLWLPSSLSVFGFGIWSLNEWSGPAERLKDMSRVWTEANIFATSKLPITPPRLQQPWGSHVSSSSGHTITLTTGFHLSRSLRSFLTDGGDKAAAKSRFERPAQMVYLCSAVPPHCCA